MAWQTCWKCGKVGHIHPKCTASYAEREAYYESKMAKQNIANAVADTLGEYVEAMYAEAIVEHHAYTAGGDHGELKPWIINSGHSAHFSLN